MSDVIVGLDIGTSAIRAVVAEELESGVLQIIGVGTGISQGLRKGSVVNIEKTVQGIHEAIEAAEMMSGVEITHCVAGIGGTHIDGLNSRGIVAVTGKGKGNREIDQNDIDRVIEAAKAVVIPMDRRVIHVIPQSYIVDEQRGIKDPRNMIGVRIEAEVHIITGSVTCMKNIIDCVKRADLQVDDFMHHGLAAVKSIMTEEEQELGSVLIDIGGGTTDIVLMSGGAPVFTGSLPVGGNHVTSDLAIVKGLSTETAENIKITDGRCWMPLVEDNEQVLISAPGGRAPLQISKMEICEIIQVRMAEIFTMVKAKIDPIIASNRFVGNVILCGGGSLLPGVTELAGEIFNSQAVRLGIPGTYGGLTGEYRSPEFAAALGLVLSRHKQIQTVTGEKKAPEVNSGRVVQKLKGLWTNLFD
ncbi:MAG: cell division protein FtsA [Treponema sp.]